MTLMADYIFELYIAGDTPRARSAVETLTHLCETWLHGRYALRVIDVLVEPERAESAKILATPTVLRLQPNPNVRLVGDLTLTGKVLTGLGLPVQVEHMATEGRNDE